MFTWLDCSHIHVKCDFGTSTFFSWGKLSFSLGKGILLELNIYFTTYSRGSPSNFLAGHEGPKRGQRE